mgnify:CR=1 FL=1|jgi:hypothetical protein
MRGKGAMLFNVYVSHKTQKQKLALKLYLDIERMKVMRQMERIITPLM